MSRRQRQYRHHGDRGRRAGLLSPINRPASHKAGTKLQKRVVKLHERKHHVRGGGL